MICGSMVLESHKASIFWGVINARWVFYWFFKRCVICLISCGYNGIWASLSIFSFLQFVVWDKRGWIGQL
jgi:hypothetical protein